MKRHLKLFFLLRKSGVDMPEIRFKDGHLITVKPPTFDLSGSGAP